MSTEALPTQVRGYLEAVQRQLADLPPEDRADLVASVEQRLTEFAGRPESLADIERQFGAPGQLAADLRTAAGFPERPGDSPNGPSPLLDWLRARLHHPAPAAVSAYVRSLRPAWWAVRGYLLLGGVLAALGSDTYRLHTIGYYRSAFSDMAPLHTTPWWALVPAAAVVASIVLGARAPRLPHWVRLMVFGLDAAAVIVLLAFPTWWLPPAGGAFAGLVN
jgi:hypothetical protein